MKTLAEIALLIFLGFVLYLFQAPLIMLFSFLFTIFKYAICGIVLLVVLFVAWVIFDLAKTECKGENIQPNLGNSGQERNN